MIQIDMQIPKNCGGCPCFHFENPMYCQAVKADKNKKIVAPYGATRPEWCPLKEQEAKQYNSHDVACIIADLFCDHCACNFNDIDTWLPYKCDFSENWCPNPAGVGCWEQYLKHREGAVKLNESTNCKETDSPSR